MSRTRWGYWRGEPVSRWDIPRRGRWPYQEGDRAPTPLKDWSRGAWARLMAGYADTIDTYESARERYIATGDEKALERMLELVEPWSSS